MGSAVAAPRSAAQPPGHPCPPRRRNPGHPWPGGAAAWRGPLPGGSGAPRLSGGTPLGRRGGGGPAAASPSPPSPAGLSAPSDRSAGAGAGHRRARPQAPFGCAPATLPNRPGAARSVAALHRRHLMKRAARECGEPTRRASRCRELGRSECPQHAAQSIIAQKAAPEGERVGPVALGAGPTPPFPSEKKKELN